MLRLLVWILVFTGCCPVVFGQGADTAVVSDSEAITGLTATVSGEKIVVGFSLKNIEAGKFLIIERSENGTLFEKLGVIKTPSGSDRVLWTDEAPAGGKNIYRIRFENSKGEEILSGTAENFIPSKKAYKFYPNPVDQILIVRSEQPLEVQLFDANGKPRTQIYKVSGLQTIDVSTLEKGQYFLRCLNVKSGQVSLDRLIKN